MPKDIRCPSKKRYRPDGLLLTSSSPKKHLSISEVAPNSSSDSARTSTIPLERLSDSAQKSLWNSASAVVTSDCSAIASVSNSPISANVVSSKHSHLVCAHWQASYNVEALQSARGLPFEASKNARSMYCTPDSNCEDTTSDSEYSGVTFARANVAEREAKGGSDLGKATHIISKREKSSLIPKWDMAADWVENSFWLDAQLRQRQRECNGALLNVRENRGFMSMATECGSFCSTNDSFVKDIRPKHGFPQTYGSIDKQSFAASLDAHGRVESFSGKPDKQKTSASFEYLNPQHSTTAVELKSSFLNQGKVDDVSPSYVLSSGRRSLEEEAKMGQCSSTIDHDFEEYFSSLMLE